MGTQPRPLKHRGRLNRRGRKAWRMHWRRLAAYLEAMLAMAPNTPWLDEGMGVPWSAGAR